MPSQTPAIASNSTPKLKLHRIVLVADQPDLIAPLESCGQPDKPLRVIHAKTASAALEYLSRHRADLAVVAADLKGGHALNLIDQMSQQWAHMATVLASQKQDFDLAQAAMRSGADDMVVTPLETQKLSDLLTKAAQRRQRHFVHADRVERLHKLCKKLNQARVDVSKQVDVLCSDLVTAYQELVCQLNNASETDQYAKLIGDELDLEIVLRKTLEHLLDKVGPSNAAIFLPATMDEFSLGGYVNYDCSAEAADLLLTSLADTLAPRLSEKDSPVHLTQQRDIERWTGDDSEDLVGRHLLGLPCHADGECLAVVVLFRDADQPMDDTAIHNAWAVAPKLAEVLNRIIRVHHRMTLSPGKNDATASDDFDVDLGYGDEDLPF